MFVVVLLACSLSKICNVIASEKPSDIAYTPMELPLHMDLTYNESTPGLQLLHCLRFDVKRKYLTSELITATLVKITVKVLTQLY